MNDTKRQRGAAGPAIPDLSIPSEEGASPPAHLHDGENHNDHSIMGFLHRLDMTYGPPVKRILMHPDFPDHCAVRGGGAVVAGGAMGVMFGLFFSGITDQGQPLKPDFKGQVKDVARSMYRSATSMAKGFAVFGGVFVAFECIIEKWRGQTDLKNSLLAGACTGTVFGARSGVAGLALSVVGTSLFSVGIDYIMMGRRWNPPKNSYARHESSSSPH
ncbi:Mitochondrial import inner membrane translocase subunit Tim22 [Balamuthia mandrillaris]